MVRRLWPTERLLCSVRKGVRPRVTHSNSWSQNSIVCRTAWPGFLYYSLPRIVGGFGCVEIGYLRMLQSAWRMPGTYGLMISSPRPAESRKVFLHWFG